LRILRSLREGLRKTRENITSKIDMLFRGRVIDEAALEELGDILLSADVGVRTTEKLIGRLRERMRVDGIDGFEGLIASLKEEMVSILSGCDGFVIGEERPYVIMFVGVNGTGKTTTIAKLAYRLKMEGKKVILAAADTFRAAAIDQLRIWAERVGVDMIKHQEGSDPGAVAYDAVSAAIARGADVVMIDTAGRIHTKGGLMEELKKIKRVVGKSVPSAPHEVILVLDATTGQNALSQARIFKEAVDITGIALTKLDGTAKGGIVMAIKEELGIPIKLVGVGEGLEDLRDFSPEEFVEGILG
jgi:fused signal recognition particle receptor